MATALDWTNPAEVDKASAAMDKPVPVAAPATAPRQLVGADPAPAKPAPLRDTSGRGPGSVTLPARDTYRDPGAAKLGKDATGAALPPGPVANPTAGKATVFPGKPDPATLNARMGRTVFGDPVAKPGDPLIKPLGELNARNDQLAYQHALELGGGRGRTAFDRARNLAASRILGTANGVPLADGAQDVIARALRGEPMQRETGSDLRTRANDAAQARQAEAAMKEMLEAQAKDPKAIVAPRLTGNPKYDVPLLKNFKDDLLRKGMNDERASEFQKSLEQRTQSAKDRNQIELDRLQLSKDAADELKATREQAEKDKQATVERETKKDELAVQAEHAKRAHEAYQGLVSTAKETSDMLKAMTDPVSTSIPAPDAPDRAAYDQRVKAVTAAYDGAVDMIGRHITAQQVAPSAMAVARQLSRFAQQLPTDDAREHVKAILQSGGMQDADGAYMNADSLKDLQDALARVKALATGAPAQPAAGTAQPPAQPGALPDYLLPPAMRTSGAPAAAAATMPALPAGTPTEMAADRAARLAAVQMTPARASEARRILLHNDAALSQPETQALLAAGDKLAANPNDAKALADVQRVWETHYGKRGWREAAVNAQGQAPAPASDGAMVQQPAPRDNAELSMRASTVAGNTPPAAPDTLAPVVPAMPDEPRTGVYATLRAKQPTKMARAEIDAAGPMLEEFVANAKHGDLTAPLRTLLPQAARLAAEKRAGRWSAATDVDYASFMAKLNKLGNREPWVKGLLSSVRESVQGLGKLLGASGDIVEGE